MWGGRGGRGGRGACACGGRGACACGGGGGVCVGGGGGGVILGEVKARPKDIISFSLDYISKSKVQTSNPSSSPIPLDTPARPADFMESKAGFFRGSSGNFGRKGVERTGHFGTDHPQTTQTEIL